MNELRLVPMDDGIGVVLPPEVLEGLGAREGDILHAMMTPDGLRVTAGDTVFQAQMVVARRVMHEQRGVLRRLAES